jgi:LmbE family N-acetylglucosaminyl deacetylase
VAAVRQLDVRRLVVVAPHPDDEVLVAGALMRRHGDVVVVAVTDGEASHARSRAITPDELRVRRAAEREEALRRLEVAPCAIVRLGAPDQGGGEHVAEIAAAVASVLRRGDLVVTVSSADPHPDHLATAKAVRRAARGIAPLVLEGPTWALVHGRAPVPTCVLDLDAGELEVKRHAMEAYRSQLVALGPAPHDGPVVHPGELAAMLPGRETFTAVST